MLGGGALGQFPLGGGPFGTTTITTIGWYANLSTPPDSRRFKASEQPFIFFNPSPIVSFGWFGNLSDPVRKKPGIASPNQSFLFYQPTPIINIGWFDWLSEPVRKKPGLTAADQLFLAFQPTPIINISWFDWLSEPVRLKPGLLDTLQQFLEEQLPQPVFLEWFAALSMPVRVKPRLMEGDQEFLARGAFVPTSYTARLDATERKDFFLGVLYQFNVALSAYVDIIENDPRHRGNMAIIDPVAEPSIVASIIEPVTAQAAGSPVSMVAGARVAIITG